MRSGGSGYLTFVSFIAIVGGITVEVVCREVCVSQKFGGRIRMQMFKNFAILFLRILTNFF